MGLEVGWVWKAGGKAHLGGHLLHHLLSAFSEALEAEEGVGEGTHLPKGGQEEQWVGCFSRSHQVALLPHPRSLARPRVVPGPVGLSLGCSWRKVQVPGLSRSEAADLGRGE